MRHLGIDYGSKRVGLSVSDEAGTIAFPMSVVENGADLVETVARECAERGIGAIIVGESRDFAGTKNEIMKKIEPFVRDIARRTGLPVFMHPEFLTSAEAERIQGKHDMLDASAAAIILQNYLDQHLHHGTETNH